MRNLSTGETGGAALLLAGTIAALIWVNINASSYEAFWHTQLSVHLGHNSVGQDLRGWVNSRLMTLVVVVDDIVALLVIATIYTSHVRWTPLLVAVGLFVVVLVLRRLHLKRGLVHGLLGAAIWLALFKSGVDPVVVGLALGMLTYAYTASRPALDLATEGFRQFREQPTAELARQARASVEAAISPNDRLHQRFGPLTSYLIVPLFALANAGIPISGHFLSKAFTSPITLGIVVGYVVGKPVG